MALKGCTRKTRIERLSYVVAAFKLAQRQARIIEQFAACFSDHRDPQRIEHRAAVLDADGRRQVLRNGHADPRTIITDVGPLQVQMPRVHDRRPPQERERFTWVLLPPYLRKTKSIKDFIRTTNPIESTFATVRLTFPQYAVSKWIGHSITISGRHYANDVPDELFTKAENARGDNSAQHHAQQKMQEATGSDLKQKGPSARPMTLMLLSSRTCEIFLQVLVRQ